MGFKASLDEDAEVIKKIERVWDEMLKSDAWTYSRILPHIPVTIDFAGEIEIIHDGKCLMAKVLKTTQLNLATKELLHITIAYHENVDLPYNIEEITKEWIGNLTMFQRVAFLRN